MSLWDRATSFAHEKVEANKLVLRRRLDAWNDRSARLTIGKTLVDRYAGRAVLEVSYNHARWALFDDILNNDSKSWIDDEVLDMLLLCVLVQAQGIQFSRVALVSSAVRTLILDKRTLFSRTKILLASETENPFLEDSGIFASLDYLFCVVNFRGNHWALVAVSFRQTILRLYDSLNTQRGVQLQCIELFKSFLTEAFGRENRGSPLPDSWRFELAHTIVDSNSPPIQTDCHSCGIFVVRFLECCLQSIGECNQLPEHCRDCMLRETPGEVRGRMCTALKITTADCSRMLGVYNNPISHALLLLLFRATLPRYGYESASHRFLSADLVRKLATYLTQLKT